AEARAGQLAADAFEGSGPGLEILHQEGLLEQFYSPAFADIPQEAFPHHRYYAPDNLLFTVMGYNTKLVKPDEVPASYQDLAAPMASLWRRARSIRTRRSFLPISSSRPTGSATSSRRAACRSIGASTARSISTSSASSISRRSSRNGTSGRAAGRRCFCASAD